MDEICPQPNFNWDLRPVEVPNAALEGSFVNPSGEQIVLTEVGEIVIFHLGEKVSYWMKVGDRLFRRINII